VAHCKHELGDLIPEDARATKKVHKQRPPGGATLRTSTSARVSVGDACYSFKAAMLGYCWRGGGVEVALRLE
jgi:hypothetical protein